MQKHKLGMTPAGAAELLYDQDLQEWSLWIGNKLTRYAVVRQGDQWQVLPSNWFDDPRPFVTFRDAAMELYQQELQRQREAERKQKGDT